MSVYKSAMINENSFPDARNLIEQLVDSENMRLAFKRVVGNKGSPGVDGMTVDSLGGYLKCHWSNIKEKLLKGQYLPKPVKQVKIPKGNGGTRLLGIPTVLDRLIQQALHQVLNPIFDPSFSENSYGFRPNKSAQQAVKQARSYQHKGKRWVIDLDLKQFFDEVNHDVLMSLIFKRVKDSNILQLIRRFLSAGIMVGGVSSQRVKGTPQGGPLSPLLSNILLNELDRELEKRGHDFCRYADDCNVYVQSKRAGERVLNSITHFLENRLRLKVNEEKSAVARPWVRTFLGFSFTAHKRCKIRVPQKTISKFRKNLKIRFRMGRGQNLKRFVNETLNSVIRGWINYYRIAETKKYAEDLDMWIRRRLRLILWRQWKRPWTRMRNLRNRGISEERAVQSAFNKRSPWFNSGASHMNEAFKKKFFDMIGLESLLERVLAFR